MRFFSKNDTDNAREVPITEEPKSSTTGSKSKSKELDRSKETPEAIHNGRTIATPQTKPQLPRTTSTRIQEPVRAATAKESSHTSSAYANNSTRAQRPSLPRRRTTAQTRYIEMLLALDTIPRLHNILASFFTWILLAGYIVFPATFNSLQQNSLKTEKPSSELEAHALETVRNAPLLYISSFACAIGVLGTLYLYALHARNFIWVINRLWLPCLMNSIAGLISTLVNIYSAQGGQYSVTAKATIIVTGVCSVVAAGLFLLWNFVALGAVKRRHWREVREFEEGERERERAEGVQMERGWLGRFKRKVKEPGTVPGSVV